MNRYDTRPASNGQHIDIVHTGASKGTGYVCRVPLREGRQEHGKQTATLICLLLNEHAQQAMGEEA